MAADFVVAVPSYQREEELVDKTLALLKRQRISPQQVYIFVANECEQHRYAAVLGDMWPNIIVGVPTLWRQRNFITNYFKEGQHVVCLDDDVEDVCRLQGDGRNGGFLESLHSGGLVELIRDAWKKMHQYNVYIWSLNVSDNPYFMKLLNGPGASLKNGLCNGFFWGCRIRKAPELALQHGDGHEDIERTLRYMKADGAVFRYREFCAKTRCKINAGGLQSSMLSTERQEEEMRSIARLTDEFPLFLTSKPGSRLGAKFRNPQSMIVKINCLSPRIFKRIVALKKLEMLIRSRCIMTFPDPSTDSGVRCYRSGVIEVARSSVGVLGISSEEGERFVASSWAFDEALSSGALVVVWVGEEACREFGIVPSRSLDEFSVLSKSLDRLKNPSFQGIEDHSIDKSLQASDTEKSDFSMHLESLVVDNGAGDSSDEEQGDEKQQVAEMSKVNQSKAAKKKQKRHEDPEWIAAQENAFDSAHTSSVASKSELNIFRDWSTVQEFEQTVEQATIQRRGAVVGNAESTSTLNELFCASRIWSGGWGGQCTHRRLLGDVYCRLHKAELLRQGYLTHGRIDGPIPPKKKLEFEKWQSKMQGQAKVEGSGASASSSTMTNSSILSEAKWRQMKRGHGESARAFEFRTGATVDNEERVRKRPAQQGNTEIDGDFARKGKIRKSSQNMRVHI